MLIIIYNVSEVKICTPMCPQIPPPPPSQEYAFSLMYDCERFSKEFFYGRFFNKILSPKKD